MLIQTMLNPILDIFGETKALVSNLKPSSRLFSILRGNPSAEGFVRFEQNSQKLKFFWTPANFPHRILWDQIIVIVGWLYLQSSESGRFIHSYILPYLIVIDPQHLSNPSFVKYNSKRKKIRPFFHQSIWSYLKDCTITLRLNTNADKHEFHCKILTQLYVTLSSLRAGCQFTFFEQIDS